MLQALLLAAKGLKSSSSFAQVAPIAGAWTVTSPAWCGDAVDLQQTCPLWTNQPTNQPVEKIMKITSMKKNNFILETKCHSISIRYMWTRHEHETWNQLRETLMLAVFKSLLPPQSANQIGLQQQSPICPNFWQFKTQFSGNFWWKPF